ncbi:YslB family protein [Alkalicoccobacillus gibsonii]|uniref:YslB family protein n=1 Tax=Alkalicoccobacillus gibsonii TaxID=79881 RepID=UPI0035168EEA
MEPKVELETSNFGYNLIRNDVLHELLGTEKETLLYWIGKSTARSYPLENTDDLISFFERAEWGTLSLVKEKPYEKTFELTGPWMGKKDQRCYQLEAGFLAQQFETQTQATAVAVLSEKRQLVQIQVTIDRHDPLD